MYRCTLLQTCRAWQEQVQKERGAGGLHVYAAALRCVPYVIPSHWAESPAALADELCSTTIHADPVLRQVRLVLPMHAPATVGVFARHHWHAAHARHLHPECITVPPTHRDTNIVIKTRHVGTVLQPCTLNVYAR